MRVYPASSSIKQTSVSSDEEHTHQELKKDLSLEERLHLAHLELNRLGVSDASLDVGVPYLGRLGNPVRQGMAGNKKIEREEIFQGFLDYVINAQRKVLDDNS